MRRPALRRCYRVEVFDDCVCLLSEKSEHVFRGPHISRLVPLLDGTHTRDEIKARLSAAMSAATVDTLLERLRVAGHLLDAECAAEQPIAALALWELLQFGASPVQSNPPTSEVSLVALVDEDVSRMTEALASFQVNVHADSWPVIVLCDDYLSAPLTELNARHLREGRPWLLVKAVGVVVSVGPLFVPGRTACWECLAERVRRHRRIESYLAQHTDRQPVSRSFAANAASRQIGISLAAIEAAKWLARGANERLENALLSFDLADMQLGRHQLVRRPQCSACGDGGRAAPQPVRIEAAPVMRTATGYRSQPAQETVLRLQHHVDSITGVITDLRRASNWPDHRDVTHSYIAGHSFAFMNEDLDSLQRSIRMRAGGKGTSDAQARASAMCEALERYSGVFQGYEHCVRASFRELGEQAIDLNECLQFSAAQYARRGDWNRRHTGKFRIPEPFDTTASIDWTPVWSLTRNEFRYLPASFCYYGHPDSERHRFCWADSNGNAAGNTREEAILQGLLELVERDCVALWWFNRARRPGVDLTSFEDPYLPAIAETYAALGRDLVVLDLTHDLGIPAFAAVSASARRPTADILYGFGAHPDAELALLRAIVEVNQSLPAVYHAKPDATTDYRPADSRANQWWQIATRKSHMYLNPDDNRPLATRQSLPSHSFEDAGQAVEFCVAAIASAGMEVLILDQTRPDIGLHVVKVVVPGLRHFWNRFAPGRLFKTPRELGWIERELAESELNQEMIYF